MKPSDQILHRLAGVALLVTLFAGLPAAVVALTSSGNVSGTVTYTGSIPGALTIEIGLHPSLNDPPFGGGTSVASPGGPYVVSGVDDGSYYVSAFLDADGSGGPPDPGEPLAWYDAEDDGTPDPIVVAGGNVTGIDLSIGEPNSPPEITELEGKWLQLGGAVSPNRAEYVDLDFYSQAEHNTPGLLFSNYQTGLTMMKWDGGPDQAWEPVGSPNFAPGGTFLIDLEISDGGASFAAYSNELAGFKASVDQYLFSGWTAVGSPNFTLAMATPLDMVLQKGSTTPFVAFRDEANGYKGTVFTFGTSWGVVGSGGFTPFAIDDIKIVLDSGNTPWVLYQSGGNLGAMTYTGSGVIGWDNVGGGTSFANSAYDISLAIDGADTLYAAFKDNANGSGVTVMKHSGPLTNTWQLVGSAGFATCGSGVATPNLALDQAGVPHVVFRNSCGGDVVVMKYTGAGPSGWEAIGDGNGFFGGPITRPVIAFNDEDTPFVAFRAGASPYHPYVMYYDSDPPVATAAVTMSEDGQPTPFDLALRGFDADGDPLTWSIAAQPQHGTAAVENTLGTTGTVTATFAYTPVADYADTDSFVVQLNDGSRAVTATVAVTLEPVNDPPTAAFADQTAATGETVILDGTLSSDVDGDELAGFLWEQLSGPEVSFEPDISRPAFIAPATPGTLTFRLTVTDTGGLSDSYEGTVWVVDGEASTAVLTDTVTLFSPPGAPFSMTVPAGAAEVTFTLVYTGGVGGSPPAGFGFLGGPFSLAGYAAGQPLSDLTFDPPFTMTLTYGENDLVGIDETTLTLVYWNGSGWVSDGITPVTRDLAGNRLVLTVGHLTDFAFIAEERFPLYLPLIRK